MSPSHSPKFHYLYYFLYFLSFIFLMSIADFIYGRPSPFFPFATKISSNRIALAHPFETYAAVGFVKGPKETLIVLKNRDERIFYLSLGQLLGREQFKLANILKQKKKITFVFTKNVHDLTGQLVTLKRYKELAKEASQ